MNTKFVASVVKIHTALVTYPVTKPKLLYNLNKLKELKSNIEVKRADDF